MKVTKQTNTQYMYSASQTAPPRASYVKAIILAFTAMFACLFTASAAITPYSWQRYTTLRDPGADATGLNHPIVSGFTGNGEVPFGTLPMVDNIAVGGPLGPEGYISRNTIRSSAQMLGGGNQGTMFVEATTNNVLLSNVIFTNGNAWGNLFQTNANWLVETWVLPGRTAGNGFVGAVLATGMNRNNRSQNRQSGIILETSGTPTSYPLIDPNNQDGHVWLRCHAVCPPGATNGNGTMDFYIGPSVLIKTPTNAAWIHAAVVRDTVAGTVAWYTNGVMVGSTPITNVYQTNYFSSVTLAGMQDSGFNAQVAANGFTGIGFNYGGAARYEGYIAETRWSHFNPGEFSVTNLLTRRVSPGSPVVWHGPVVVTEPQSVTVWQGAAAPFACVAATDTTLQYQWQRGGVDIAGATNRLYVLENTTGGDNGAQFRCILTRPVNGLTATSAVATLTVQANAPAFVTGYSNSIMSEASLLAYFPMDGTGGTVNNVKNPAYSGGISNAPFALRNGTTNLAVGNQAMSFNVPNLEYAGGVLTNNEGYVTVPGDLPGLDFATASSGNGTVEAVIYLDPVCDNILKTGGGGAEIPTFLSSATAYNASMANTKPAFDFFTFGADANGNITYMNSYPTTLVWPVPGGVLGKKLHVAFVFSNTTNVTLYVNGINLGTKQQFGFGNTPPSASQALTIGKRGGGNGTTDGYMRDTWRGTIDELAIYSTALSQAKIQEHVYRLANGTNNSPATVSISPGSKTLYAGFPLQNLTAVVGGNPPYTYQWRANSVNIPNATNIVHTVSGLGVGAFPYDVVVQGSVGGAVTSAPITLTVVTPTGYGAKVFASSGGAPKAFYPLDETSGNLVFDWAGTHDGVKFGSYSNSVGSDGPFGGTGALRMFGSNLSASVQSRAEIPYYAELNPNSGNFTHEFWYKPDITNISSCPVSSQVTGNGSKAGLATILGPNPGINGIAQTTIRNWTMIYGKYNNLNQGVAQGGAGGVTPAVPGEYQHIVSAADATASSVAIYVNGNLDFQQNVGYSVHPLDASTTGGVNQNYYAPLILGNYNPGSLGTFPMAGRLSQVAIYDYVLSFGDITNHTSQFWTNALYTTQPAATTTTAEASNNSLPQNQNVTLSAVVRGLPNQYQWYKMAPGNVTSNPVVQFNNLDGTPHYPEIAPLTGPIQGPQGRVLVINQPKTNDSGVYFLKTFNPMNTSTGGSTNSTLATVTITPETTLPVAQSASARGVTASGPVLDDVFASGGNATPAALNSVVVRFSERVDWATATNPANYVISGGVTVTNVILANSPAEQKFGGDYRAVGLQTTGLTPGNSYTITITNVYDQATTPNKMANTTLSFTAPALRSGSAVWNYYHAFTYGNNFVGIQANTNSTFPYVPSYTAALTNFGSDSVALQVGTSRSLNNNAVFSGGQADSYVSTVTAWVTPTNTGNYQLWITGDDHSRLYMNPTGSDPAGAIFIDYSFGNFGENDYAGFSIGSNYFTLNAGQPYFMQAVHSEGGGNDNIRIAWRYLGTNGTVYDGLGNEGAWIIDSTNLPAIEGKYLSSYAPGAISITVQPTNILATAAGVNKSLFVGVAPVTGGIVTNYTWYESASISGNSGNQGTSNPINFAPLEWNKFATNWYAVVNDGSQFVTSSVVSITPASGIGFTLQPASRAIALNAINNSLNFTATNSVGAINYQWQKDGTNIFSVLWNPNNGFSNPSGNSSTFAGNNLTFNIMQAGMAGGFRVIATDPYYGLSVTSTVATVTLATNQTITTTPAGANVNLGFNTENGPQYVLEWKGALTNGNWNTYRTIVGTGVATNLPVAKTNTQSYFRLRMQ